MPNENGKFINIENFSHNGKCPFCFELFDSNFCLLPLSLTNQTQTGDESKISNINVLNTHNLYGISNLNSNLLITKRIKHINEQNSYSKYSVQTDYTNLNPNSTLDSISNDKLTTPNTTHQNKYFPNSTDEIEPNLFSHDLEDTKLKGHSTYHSSQSVHDALVDPQKVEINNISASKDTVTQTQTRSNSNQPEQLKSTISTIPITYQHNHVINQDLMDEHFHRHLVSDLTIAYVTTFKLDSNNENHVTMIKLIDSILKNVNLHVNDHFPRESLYHAKLNQTLVTSSEIFASHSKESLVNWKNGTISHPPGCILAFPKFTPSLNSIHNDTIQNVLFQYIKDTWNSQTISLLMNKDVLRTDILVNLEQKGFTQAYAWCNSRIYSTTKNNSTTFSKIESANSNEDKLNLSNTTNTLSQLPSIINKSVQKELSKHNSKKTYHDMSTTLNSFYLTMTKEFIKNNQGWQNKNSFQNEKQVAKLLNICNFQIQKEALAKILIIEGNILHQIREEVKNL
jgi:hypothetical protein